MQKRFALWISVLRNKKHLSILLDSNPKMFFFCIQRNLFRSRDRNYVDNVFLYSKIKISFLITSSKRQIQLSCPTIISIPRRLLLGLLEHMLSMIIDILGFFGCLHDFPLWVYPVPRSTVKVTASHAIKYPSIITPCTLLSCDHNLISYSF